MQHNNSWKILEICGYSQNIHVFSVIKSFVGYLKDISIKNTKNVKISFSFSISLNLNWFMQCSAMLRRTSRNALCQQIRRFSHYFSTLQRSAHLIEFTRTLIYRIFSFPTWLIIFRPYNILTMVNEMSFEVEWLIACVECFAIYACI